MSSENPNGLLKKGIWTVILRTEDAVELDKIRNIKDSRYSLKDYFINENIYFIKVRKLVQNCDLVLQSWNWKQTIIYRTNRLFSETCSYIMNAIHGKSFLKNILLKFIK